MMKGLVTVGAVLILWAAMLTAGPIEIYFSGGPAAASLGAVNAEIELINVILRDLNDTPTVDGEVSELEPMGSGFAYQAGERYWFFERLTLGGKLEYFRTATSTTGNYTSLDESEISEISIALDCYAVGLVVGGRYDFLDAGVVLSADFGVGYYYSGFTSNITFEMPSSYPPISVHPQEGEGRYSGFALGFESGLSLSFPITDWLEVGSSLFYRSLTLGEMRDRQGNSLDLDGDGTPEKVDLGGITVQFTFSLIIDLNPEREKE
ncbi:hypothetical protein KAX17_09905 [Candidatus Bipolaricaulota bacterium]|nr:hypothetical protein [Candidatus Bipolaricaulota bacterium]